MRRPPRVWVLVDDRPGHADQALGVAEALGWPFEVKRLSYSRLARLPDVVLGSSTFGLEAGARAGLRPPWPDLVIAAGRRLAPVARWLGRRHAGTFVVQLMWPGSGRGLDLIAVPEHDAVAAGPTLVRTLGVAHRITGARLATARAAWAGRWRDLPPPRVACLVGGRRRWHPFTASDATELGRQAAALARGRGGSLLVTTSRRTGESCVRALAGGLDVPHALHRWSSAEHDNPCLAMLASADAVIVTADSVTMCCEACATGQPVFLYRPAGGCAPKLERLHRRLEGLGHVRPLGAPWPASLPPPPESAAAVVAGEIRARLVARWAKAAARTLAPVPQSA